MSIWVFSALLSYQTCSNKEHYDIHVGQKKKEKEKQNL